MAQFSQQRVLGRSGIVVSPLGAGTNRWGGDASKDEQVFQTFRTDLDVGINFFDTAEIYTGGRSERALGSYIRRDNRPAVVASKFAPLPTRLSAHTLMDALDATLRRLQMTSIDLYYVHWPYTFLRIEALMDELALAVQLGKIRAVGVSNYSADQVRRASERLARYNIPLAANEVHYSLFHRQPESNGVLDICRELDIALVAYRPLSGGRLLEPIPAANTTRSGVRSALGRDEKAAKLRQVLAAIAHEHDKTVGQVVLNWLLLRDEHIIPIPGTTSPAHASENNGALGWQLTDDEFVAIDQASLA